MCATCGCGADGASFETGTAPHTHADEHQHTHGRDSAAEGGHAHSHAGVTGHGRGHEHAHDEGATRRVQIEQDILAKNDAYAAQNRQLLAERGVFAVNLVSSPGSGKTTLLCKTIALLQGTSVVVIEGDQQTSRDAERIRATGAPAVQINTGRGCHLDAHMVGHAIARLDLPEDALLMIENVGNLVCPAAFDLGEALKVVIFSVTEGEDKPIKYPDMFRAASLMLLSKIDLLPHLEFDVDAAIGFARRVNPDIRVIQVSAVSGAGMGEWLDFLRKGMQAAQTGRQDTVAHLKRRVAQLEAQLQQSQS